MLMVSVFMLGLAGCAEQGIQPQSGSQTPPQPGSATPADPAQAQVPVHNLSRVAVAKPVSAELLATIVEGKTTTAELVQLLGEIKPFTLGDGKQIYRYDLGKFIFGADGVLLRQHLNH